jgi:hypothetical protein
MADKKLLGFTVEPQVILSLMSNKVTVASWAMLVLM